MNVIGIRCSNKDYTFTILRGNRNSPEIMHIESVNFPKGFGRAKSLHWFKQELEDLFSKNSIQAIGIKGAETSVKRTKTLECRIENETIIYLCGIQIGIRHIIKKVKVTIAKDLGLKGKAKYLETKLDTSLIPNFSEYSEKQRESVLVAWSMF